MAKGRTHDAFNLFFGMVATGVLIGLGLDFFVWPFFLIGWLFATLIFSPDTDIMPKKRSGLLQFFLYPYSILFKHRGLSHGIILGTLSRVAYAIILGGIVIFVLAKMGYVTWSPEGYWKGLWEFINDYNYQLPVYRSVTWLYLGLAGADLSHISLDKISSFFGKLRRYY